MKKIMIMVVLFLAVSCTKKEFIISIEQPNDKMLDRLRIDINVDRQKDKTVYLRSTSIVPSQETITLEVSNEGTHSLEVKLKDTIFNFKINYPSEKYIIISPFLKKNGKIKLGILKQKEEFLFH